MFKTLKNSWKIPELKNKLLFTLLIVILYRLGSALPVPYVNVLAKDAMADYWSGGNILSFINMLTGGALGQGTLFALGVSPYITASIVMQLLSIAIPYFEKKSKEGEEGKKVINAWTRGVTMALAIITAIGYVMMLNSYGMLLKEANVFVYFVMVACYCAGAALVMWLAERINDHGIGNGISIILFANIIAGIPGQLAELWTTSFANPATGGFDVWGLVVSIFFGLILLAMLLLIVWMSDAERRIPIQYAKRVVGRKMYGGQNTNLPIKVNMSGVMPIIFANSIVAILPTIASFVAQKDSKNWFVTFVTDWFSPTTWPYLIVFFVLLIAFAYFYVAISFNPIEVANNIKNNGGAIPGIRSGRPTIQYIKKILNRITLIGAIFLAVIAVLPLVINLCTGNLMSELAFGGSSIIIVVGVVLETAREIEAQMTMRHYKGFLD